MREDGHLSQTKLNNKLDKMKVQGIPQEEMMQLESEKKFMTINEVVSLLNKNKSIETVSQILEMRTNVLEAKLVNAAVLLNSEGQWKYCGGNQNESLSRNIYSKIFVKSYDKNTFGGTDSSSSNTDDIVSNLDFELYKNSLSIKGTIDKKSVLFEGGLYNQLKLISNQKSIKISNLINALIHKGLEYYRLK